MEGLYTCSCEDEMLQLGGAGGNVKEKGRRECIFLSAFNPPLVPLLPELIMKQLAKGK
jgi:hypothetical protein